tara:strand:- start:747 stop:1376 length:630 start_codon:yes stop_codon:yes gene_type:complete
MFNIITKIKAIKIQNWWNKKKEQIICKNYIISLKNETINKFELFELNNQFIKVGNICKTKNTRLHWNINIDIPIKEYNKRQNLVYIITYNGIIVKIGGTKTGLKGRINSYYCGYYIRERKKKNGKYYPGKCSVTNANIYNTIYYYLLKNNNFELYYYPIPDMYATFNIFGKIEKKKIETTYEYYESHVLNKFKEQFKSFPILSINSHPK